MSSNAVRFSAVEQMDEAARSLGWSMEYRQLNRGRFSAALAGLQHGEIHLAAERFNRHLEICSEPPEGFVGFFLSQSNKGWVRVSGKTLGAGDLMMLPDRSELKAVTCGLIRNQSLFMPQQEFLGAARALVRSESMVSTGRANVYHCDPTRFGTIASSIDSSFQEGEMNREIASHILAGIIQLVADASSISCTERLSNGAAAAIALRARNYIEEHFREMIRMEELCSHAGTSLRTLHRCFAAHFQMSPTAYIKSRRLNAAHRELAAEIPGGTSVTDVAMRSGFTHLGRFSVDYRAHFGEPPSKRLAR